MKILGGSDYNIYIENMAWMQKRGGLPPPPPWIGYITKLEGSNGSDIKQGNNPLI